LAAFAFLKGNIVSNTILTPSMVTKEALRVLHQKLNFVSKISRQYDDSFAKEGAKIGDTLKIRLPNRYTVTTGRVLTAQDTTESSVSLQIATQKHVGMNFTSNELTLSLDDFSERIIEPAMAVLAAAIESDAMGMFGDVYNAVNNVGSAINLNKIWTARKLLNDNLAPMDKRYCVLNTQDAVDFMDAAKGLFHSSQQIEDQYTEGDIGRFSGLDFAENTLIPTVTTGTDASNCTVNGPNQTGSAITITNGSSKTFSVGDVVTFAGCYRVHPETKVSTGVLHQFVVTTAVTAGGTTMNVSPALTLTGALQNISAAPTDTGAITKVGSASTVYKPSVVFHKEAFALATADLIMPKGVDFAAREVMDGLSMRLVRQYDINNDNLVTRLDVLYGYKTVRPQLAARILSN
jgi:hypothetical protein